MKRIIFIGPFLLTQLLLDDLKKTAEEEGADVRIVNVTSSIHDPEQSKKGKGKYSFSQGYKYHVPKFSIKIIFNISGILSHVKKFFKIS